MSHPVSFSLIPSNCLKTQAHDTSLMLLTEAQSPPPGDAELPQRCLVPEQRLLAEPEPQEMLAEWSLCAVPAPPCHICTWHPTARVLTPAGSGLRSTQWRNTTACEAVVRTRRFMNIMDSRRTSSGCHDAHQSPGGEGKGETPGPGANKAGKGSARIWHPPRAPAARKASSRGSPVRENGQQCVDAAARSSPPFVAPTQGEGGWNRPHASQARAAADRDLHAHLKGKQAGSTPPLPCARASSQEETQLRTVWPNSPFSPVLINLNKEKISPKQCLCWPPGAWSHTSLFTKLSFSGFRRTAQPPACPDMASLLPLLALALAHHSHWRR